MAIAPSAISRRLNVKAPTNYGIMGQNEMAGRTGLGSQQASFGGLQNLQSLQAPHAPAAPQNNSNANGGVGGAAQAPGVGPVASGPDPYSQAAAARGLAFNPVYAEQFRGLDRTLAQSQSDTDLQLQRLVADIQSRMQGLDTGEQQARSQLLDRMAAQGILRSGITANEEGRVGTEYNTQRNELQSQGARLQDDARRGLVNQQADIENQRATLLASQARDEQAQREQQAYQQAQAEIMQRLLQAQQDQTQAQQPQPTPTGQYQPAQPVVTPAINSKLALLKGFNAAPQNNYQLGGGYRFGV